MKYYRVTFDYALHQISYENFLLYSAAIPSYSVKRKTDKEGRTSEVIKADDPKNRDLVKAIINGYKF